MELCYWFRDLFLMYPVPIVVIASIFIIAGFLFHGVVSDTEDLD